MVSLLILTPLVLALTLALAVAFAALRKKSLAQAICLQQAARVQDSLRAPFEKLLRLNPHAETLRVQRTAADDSLAAAVSSGVPYAIAAAQAVQTAVILAQIAFHARQLALLAEAERLRAEGRRELRARAAHLAARRIQTPAFYFRALAVEPKPVASPSPNYEPITMFRIGQQTRFQFEVDLLAEFPTLRLGLNNIQKTECAVTLQQRSEHWQIQILAAKAQ